MMLDTTYYWPRFRLQNGTHYCVHYLSSGAVISWIRPLHRRLTCDSWKPVPDRSDAGVLEWLTFFR